ncbi:MAG: hypothetical protein AAFY91_09405, partial [Bacteroidota bacterium]
PFQSYFSVSNFSNGLGWQDSLIVDQAIIATANFVLELNNIWHLELNGIQDLPILDTRINNWAYTIGAGFRKNMAVSMLLRYDQYGIDVQPALGTVLKCEAPLGKFGQMSVMLNWRFTSNPSDQIFSNQHWHGNLF